MTYIALLINVARVNTMQIGRDLRETDEVCSVQGNDKMMEENYVNSDELAIRVEHFSGDFAAGSSCSTTRRWFAELLGQKLLLIFLLCIRCEDRWNNEDIEEFHGKMPATTVGEMMDLADGTGEMQRTYNFQFTKAMNEELTENENQMKNLTKMSKDGRIYEMVTMVAIYDSDWSFRMVNKEYQKSMHVGASAATLLAFEGAESHTEIGNLNSDFISEFLQKPGVGGGFKILNLKMVGCQKAHSNKPKHKKTDLENHTLQLCQRQQREAQASAIEDAKLSDENGSELNEGMHKNTENGKYKKTIYVKTWTGRTITAEISPGNVAKYLKRQIEEKTGIPVGSQNLVAGGKVLKDNLPLKEYGLLGGETIEMTGQLLGGMKKKSLSPKPMETEREKKRKESEPCIEVGDSLEEEENAQTQNDIDPSNSAKWIEDTMKRLKDRTDDLSDLEMNVTGMQRQMTGVEQRLESQDKKLDTLLNYFKEGMEVREKKWKPSSNTWKKA